MGCDIIDMHLFELSKTTRFTTTKFRSIYRTSKKRPLLRDGSFCYTGSMSCEICPILSDPSSEELAARLIEGTHWIATLRSNDQALLGTSFITAKRHVEALSELTPDEQLEFFTIHNDLERAIKQAFGAAVINTSCLMNHAFRGSLPQPHVHWHLKPRYKNPVHIDDQVYADPGFGFYLDGHHERMPVSLEQVEAIVSKIKYQL